MTDYISHLGYEHPVKQKWQDVFVKMRVHTQGYSPDHIFESRRPEESKNPEAFQYRKDNFRPISKAPFDLAIDGYIEVAQLLDVTISSDDSKKIEKETFVYDGLKKSDLREWYIKVPGAYRQTDPNAVVVVLPKHPTDVLNPSFESEFPNFNNIQNLRIGVDIRLVISSDIVYLNQEKIVFKAGKWKYKVDKTREYWEDYYYALDKDFTYVVYPVKEKDSFKYKQEVFYNNGLTICPAVAIGGKVIREVTDCDDGKTYIEYYTADFSGAAAWGDYSLGQMSDLQICERRFSHPEKWVVKKDCGNYGASMINGVHCTPNNTGGFDTCTSCRGAGYIIDSSPLGTHLIDKKAGFDESGNFIAPVGFITPDVGILDHSAKRTESYYDYMLRELGILKQNDTNQSGVSKMYDAQNKVTLYTNIVTDIYRGYAQLLNILQGYLFRKSDTVITLPEDFDVKNANDLSIELAEMKKNGASHNDLVEQNKRVMLKKYGDSEFNRWAQDVLAKYDKLYPYALAEIQQAKAIFGASLTDTDINLHYFGYEILKDLYRENESVAKSTDVLSTLFDRLKIYAPVPVVQTIDFE
jgi:hypothetical protein